MLDPELTPHGKQQCGHLKNRFPHHKSVELLVASPLRRTLHTALLAFAPEIKKGMSVLALPEAQETGEIPCDTGSDVETLQNEFKEQPVDLGLVTEGWNSKQGKWASTSDRIVVRAQEVRQWLKARPENEIVLVTHGGFLHYLTEDWTDYAAFSGIEETE